MSDTPRLVARVEALEKAVQSLLGAVNLLEELFEKSGVVGGGAESGGSVGAGAKKVSGVAKKKRAPVKKRVKKS